MLSIGLNEKNKYRGDPPKAKNNAFRHLLINGRFELSSFCIDELTEENCWKLLDLNSNKDKIPARVDLTVDFVRKNTALDIEPDWNPKRHVNLSHKTEINIIAAKQKMMSQLNVTLR